MALRLCWLRWCYSRRYVWFAALTLSACAKPTVPISVAPTSAMPRQYARRVTIVELESFAKLSCDRAFGGGMDGPCGSARIANTRFERGTLAFAMSTKTYALDIRVPLDSAVTEFKCRSRRYPSGCISEVRAHATTTMGSPPPFSGKWALLEADSSSHARSVHAFNTMVAIYRGFPTRDPELEFAAQANAWRTGDRKPPSAERDKHRILAENAFREKNLSLMLAHFEWALEYDPTWPDGNFNMAVALGDSSIASTRFAGYYSLAAYYMKRYLLLMPDSPDARALRERIIIWEDKARVPTR